jgi:hypothetical protein
MSGTRYIPTNDVQFVQWLNILLTFLQANAARLNFPLDVLSKLQLLFSDFVTKLALAEDPATRTSVVVQNKIDARKVLEKETRGAIKEFLTNNHAVTNGDRDAMGLPIPKTTRTPAEVAKTYPDFDIDSSVIRWLTIHFFDQGKQKSKAKPPGQHGAEIGWVISETPIVNTDELAHSAFDTRTPFSLEFRGDERGKTVYFALRWENTRGEKGPWSEIQSAIIP